MTDRPRLSQIDIWAEHERQCLAVLHEGLALLVAEPPAYENEDDINRELCLCIAEANHRATRANASSLPPITYEGRNPPVASDAERAAREHKRPDFLWGLTDHLATDPRSSAKHFVVECKRLAPTRRRDWVYTEQYVVSGILRFVDPGHGYGKGTRSGVMVGYLEGLELDAALDEVNSGVTPFGLPALQTRSERDDDCDEFEQALTRSFAESPYSLIHVWCRIESNSPSPS